MGIQEQRKRKVVEGDVTVHWQTNVNTFLLSAGACDGAQGNLQEVTLHHHLYTTNITICKEFHLMDEDTSHKHYNNIQHLHYERFNIFEAESSLVVQRSSLRYCPRTIRGWFVSSHIRNI